MRRSLLIAVAVVAQVGALLWMVYGRESIVTNGMRISLTTAPIDPRDPFRGDFVRLRYPMNSFANAPISWTSDNAPERGDIVYAVFEETYDGEYSVTSFTTDKPDGGVFLRGRRQSRFNNQELDNTTNTSTTRIDVLFGVEQFYLEQDSGIEIEKRQGVRGGMQNAMRMEVAVDKSGTAVITGYRWNDVAIQLEVTERFNDTLAPTLPSLSTDVSADITTPLSENTDGEAVGKNEVLEPHVRLTIQNMADTAVTLNNPPDDCGFLLERVGQRAGTGHEEDSTERPRPANEGCTADDDIDTLTLAPGETYQINVDLTQERWQVAVPPDTDASDDPATHTVSLVDLRSDAADLAMYRITYRASRTRSATPALWQGDIVSQAFSSQGLVD